MLPVMTKQKLLPLIECLALFLRASEVCLGRVSLHTMGWGRVLGQSAQIQGHIRVCNIGPKFHLSMGESTFFRPLKAAFAH